MEIGSFRPDKSESDSGFFKSIGLEINIRGGFLPTLVFFDQVSKMKRVMNFEEIKMRVMNQNKEEAVPVLETNVKLKAFRLGDA